MSYAIKTKQIQSVVIQENGIIRNSKGYLIGRLVSGINFDSDHLNESDSTAYCMEYLSGALRKDDSYAYSWHANIAMACMDSIIDVKEKVAFDSHSDYHFAGNEAAERFMKICFDVETSLHMLEK